MLLTEQDIKIKKEVCDADYGRFVIEPLPAGYGYTLGSAIRRVMLSSIRGAAPTQIEIEGANHPFTTIKGIKEDVVEITLNFKKLRVKLINDNPVVLTVNTKGQKEVTGADLECPSDAEVVNKDLHLVTLSDKSAKFEAKILVEPGYGYVPSEDRQISKIGVIVLDSIFTPVVSVGYSVEPTRVGQTTGLDKLTIEVKTDGTVDPYAVFMEASRLLSIFFSRLSTGKECLKEEEEVKPVARGNGNNHVYEPSDVSVEELHLPTRTINALKKAGIKTLADLSKLSNDDLSHIRNLGEKSVEEIKKLLEKEGLNS